jgi:uncharacterized membrane protein
MINVYKNWVINTSLCVAIIVTCLIGDKKLNSTKSSHLVRALADNITHGLIGLFSGAILFVDCLDKMYFAIFCMFFASAIDIDHFIAARSFHFHVSAF